MAAAVAEWSLCLDPIAGNRAQLFAEVRHAAAEPGDSFVVAPSVRQGDDLLGAGHLIAANGVELVHQPPVLLVGDPAVGIFLKYPVHLLPRCGQSRFRGGSGIWVGGIEIISKSTPQFREIPGDVAQRRETATWDSATNWLCDSIEDSCSRVKTPSPNNETSGTASKIIKRFAMVIIYLP